MRYWTTLHTILSLPFASYNQSQKCHLWYLVAVPWIYNGKMTTTTTICFVSQPSRISFYLPLFLNRNWLLNLINKRTIAEEMLHISPCFNNQEVFLLTQQFGRTKCLCMLTFTVYMKSLRQISPGPPCTSLFPRGHPAQRWCGSLLFLLAHSCKLSPPHSLALHISQYPSLTRSLSCFPSLLLQAHSSIVSESVAALCAMPDVMGCFQISVSPPKQQHRLNT